MKLENYKLLFEHISSGYDSLEEYYFDIDTFECPLTELKPGQPVPFKTQNGREYSSSAYWAPKFVCKTVNTDGVLIEISGNNRSFKSTEDVWEYNYEINGKSDHTYRLKLEQIK